MFNKFLANDSQ